MNKQSDGEMRRLHSGLRTLTASTVTCLLVTFALSVFFQEFWGHNAPAGRSTRFDFWETVVTNQGPTKARKHRTAFYLRLIGGFEPFQANFAIDLEFCWTQSAVFDPFLPVSFTVFFYSLDRFRAVIGAARLFQEGSTDRISKLGILKNVKKMS